MTDGPHTRALFVGREEELAAADLEAQALAAADALGMTVLAARPRE